MDRIVGIELCKRNTVTVTVPEGPLLGKITGGMFSTPREPQLTAKAAGHRARRETKLPLQ